MSSHIARRCVPWPVPERVELCLMHSVNFSQTSHNLEWLDIFFKPLWYHVIMERSVLVSFSFSVFADLLQACIVVDLCFFFDIVTTYIYTEAACVSQPSECR